MHKTSYIIIVDDVDPRLIKISVMSGLPHDKFSVIPYKSGKGALNDIRRGQLPLLAVLDLHMPEMNGIELAEEIKKLSPETYIIIATADDNLMRNELDTAQQQKIVDEVLIKPVTYRSIRDLINDLTKRVTP